MNAKLLLFLLFLPLSSLADEEYLTVVKASYGFDSWSTNGAPGEVSQDWIPDLGLGCTDSSVVTTNRNSTEVIFSVFDDNSQSAEVHVSWRATIEQANDDIVHFLSDCTSTRLFVQGTNAWNQIGHVCYVDNPTERPSICIFRIDSFVGLIFSDDIRYQALQIATNIQARLYEELDRTWSPIQ